MHGGRGSYTRDLTVIFLKLHLNTFFGILALLKRIISGWKFSLLTCSNHIKSKCSIIQKNQWFRYEEEWSGRGVQLLI